MGIFNRKNIEVVDENGNFSPAPFNAPRAVIASSRRIDPTNKSELDALVARRKTGKWQQEAWDYYDLIGEIKYSVNLIANVLSRVHIYAAYLDDFSGIPSSLEDLPSLDDDDKLKSSAYNTLYWLTTGNGGMSGLLRDMALNLQVAGECYLVQEKPRLFTGEPERWQIRSIDEVIYSGDRISIKPTSDTKKENYIQLAPNSYISRIWKSHPRYSDEADSSFKGILELCDELLLLSRSIKSAAKTQISAGLLFIPDTLSNVAQNDGDLGLDPDEMADLSDDSSDNIEEDLAEALMAPIGDDTSAASVVPTILRGQEDAGEKIRYITFDRPIDAQLTTRSAVVLERILSGVDIPKDIAAGMSNVKYASASVIEESLYKAHIEPLILTIVDNLTVCFLQPALRKLGFPEDVVRKVVIWYDPSMITAKPSKAEAADFGYMNKTLSADAWRRNHGFADSDAPTPLEVAQRIAIERTILSEAMNEKLLSTVIPADVYDSVRKDELANSDPQSAQALTDALVDTDPNTPPSDNPAPTPPSDLIEP